MSELNIKKTILKLKNRLQQTLPGADAQNKMRSVFRTGYIIPEPNEKTKNSAVLIILYPYKNEIYFPLILRSTYDGTHSGQIGLPGGKAEPIDQNNLSETALREANEEVGLIKKDIKILGQLSRLFVHASNHMMYPFVGYTKSRPDFILDKREVDRLFEVPFSELKRPDIVKETDILIGPNLKIRAPYYNLFNQTVWGATAMVLSELLMVLD